jgi:hypothetical protein
MYYDYPEAWRSIFLIRLLIFLPYSQHVLLRQLHFRYMPIPHLCQFPKQLQHLCPRIRDHLRFDLTNPFKKGVDESIQGMISESIQRRTVNAHQLMAATFKSRMERLCITSSFKQYR